MDEAFDTALMGAFTDDGGAPDEAPAASDGTPVATEAAEGGAPEPEAPADEDDLRSILEQQKAAHPEQAAIIDAIHREFQRGLTPKLQQAAELRRQYEGITPELAGWVRQMNELAAASPAEAAAALMAEAQRLQGLQQAAPPEEAPEFYSDAERLMWEKLQRLEQFEKQAIAERNEAIVNQAFSEIEKEFGAIPYEERYRVIAEMHRDGASPHHAKRYWRDLYFDRALQKARDEAAGVVAKKAGLAPPPSSLANRAGTGAPPEPKSFEDAALYEFRARNLL